MAAGVGDPRQNLLVDLAMVLLAIASVAILVVEEVYPVSERTHETLWKADLAIVAVFWFEYGLRLVRAPNKKKFLKQNWYEPPGMIPIVPGLEALGPVRLLRLLRMLRILRFLGVMRRFPAYEQFVKRFVSGTRMGILLLAGLAVLNGSAALAWTVEPESFPTYGDALWWAIVTASTVGYGDFFPRTMWGRIAAAPLMLLGVGIIATLAATMSAVLVDRGPKPPEPKASTTAQDLERVAALHDQGRLTDDEFSAAKQRILGPPRNEP